MSAQGAAVADLLSGSWRVTPAPYTGASTALEPINERLQATGAGGLAWKRIEGSSLADTPEGRSLRDAFRLQVLDARLREESLHAALDLVEGAGVQPVLAKGWAMARAYPHAGLRPYGDFDLFVAPSDLDAAQAAIATCRDRSLRVDLHAGVPRYGGTWADVQARARPVPLGSRTLRIFGPEDHLGLLSSHLLFHGAWRPLWLVDIALLVETLPDDFDWGYVMALPRRQVEELRVAVRLAHEVLGAEIADTPWSGARDRLPAWLPAATMAAWSAGHYSTTTALALTEARGGSVLRSLRLRWPNPIEVTHRWGASYGAMPRLPLQLWDVAVRGARGLLDAPSRLRARRGLAKREEEGHEPR
jgi:hypothetical protein